MQIAALNAGHLENRSVYIKIRIGSYIILYYSTNYLEEKYRHVVDLFVKYIKNTSSICERIQENANHAIAC